MSVMSDPINQRQGVKLTPAQEKSRRNRNIAIGLMVTLFAVLLYAVTVVKLGPSVISGPM